MVASLSRPCAALVAWVVLGWSSWSAAQAPDERHEWHARGSTVTYAPLAPGVFGMSVAGGFALALPYQAFEVGVGLGADFDMKLRYQAIVGLLHQLELHGRWAPLALGDWRLGIQLGLGYDLFGLASDALNLTSTLFALPGLGASCQVSDDSHLLFGIAAEVDLLEFLVLDGESTSEESLRLDAFRVQFGWKTGVFDELDAFIVGRLRVPAETSVFGGEPFSVVPFVEAGGSWAW